MKKTLAVILCILVLLVSMSCIAFAAGGSGSSETDSPSISSVLRIIFGNGLTGYGKVLARTAVVLRNGIEAAKNSAEDFLAWFTRIAEPFNNINWKSLF